MKAVQTRARVEIKNVLFPTDFSAAGDAAIPYAAEIVKRFGAKLYALHVRPPVINPMTEPATWPVLEKAAAAQAEAQEKSLQEVFKASKPEVLIAEGNFWEILQSAVETHKIDLIVLGTRGRSGAGKLFLGSKAEEIFRQVPCAVMTVGPHANGITPRHGEFTEILFATDFSPESSAAAAYAISLAQEFQARLTLLHVIPDEKPGDLILPGELVPVSEQRLRKLVPSEAELWCEPRFAVEQGAAAETILQVAKDRKADLIVLGVRPATGFPGAATHLPMATAHKVVAQAACPVLTVRG
ncbi:MAG: universal stress protein [Candidatus Acidiferrales bacterium]